MNKPLLTLLAISAATLSLTACMHNDATDLPPGEYKKTTASTDSNGTDYKTDTTTNVKVDRYGNKTATTSTEVTKDPEGLMNKSTTKSTSTATKKTW